MKIAFLRGAHLNPWELQNYQNVAKKHPFTAVGADWQFYTGPLNIPGIPVKKVHLWGAGLSAIGHGLPVGYNRILSWTTGRSFGLAGLEEAIENPDIIHSAELYSTMTFQALQLKRRLGCRLAVTVWENLPGAGETHPARRRRKHAVISELDGILAVTETTKRMLVSEGVAPERIQVILPAIDLQRFRPGPRDSEWIERLQIRSDDFVILFIGRLVPEKGILELLAAIPEVLKQCKSRPPRFVFGGQGPLIRELEVARRRWPEAVKLLPFMSYSDIPGLHRLADVFVLPSKATPKWEEQFGYVLVESMASGKPVITTRSGSIPDVVGNGARLVAPGNAGDLAVALVNLVTSDGERTRLGALARNRAETFFGLDQAGSRILRFYERLNQGLAVGVS